MLKVKITILALMFLVCNSWTTKGQTAAAEESPLVIRVERTIKSQEPGWTYIRGVQSARVPVVPSEKTLVASSWERKPKNGRRESVTLNIYEVESSSEAAAWLRPFSSGKAATGWRFEKFEIGDEGYLSKFQNGRRYALYFRKGNIVVEISGDSPSRVKEFAQYVVSS